jgi:hypothetical protein
MEGLEELYNNIMVQLNNQIIHVATFFQNDPIGVSLCAICTFVFVSILLMNIDDMLNPALSDPPKEDEKKDEKKPA